MLAPVTHILPLTNIRRSRTLPVPGQVLVRAGQKVGSTDVISQARIPSGHMLLDIRRGLGIPSATAAERCIVRQPGDRLEKGDVIAESGGLFSRIVRAPANGEIVLISVGQVLMEVRSTTLEVKAGFDGMVSELLGDVGAVVETNGALIQGVWGNGKVDSGLLLLVAHTPDEELTRQKLDVGMRGGVVLAGTCSDADALRAAGEIPLRGLILSSLAADLIPVAAGLGYAILLVEGFGQMPMNETAYKLLSTSEKRDISVNGVWNPLAGERPELVIPLPASGQAAPETDYFAPEKAVRIQGAPYAGRLGKIVQVRPGFSALPNGIKAPAAEVELDHDTQVTVPLANLEVIE
jgi:hypothetical protein